jgi:predicted ATPase with chaperone activity
MVCEQKGTEEEEMVGMAAVPQVERGDLELPPAPLSVEETGLDAGLLVDLALKTVYFAGNPSGAVVAERMALPLGVVQEILAFLRREHLCEVTGGSGTSPATFLYAVTGEGVSRVSKVLELSGYVGPAPVPLADYIQQVEHQSVGREVLTSQDIESSLSHLVFNAETLDRLGRAVSSEKATLVFGPSGNGKTAAAEGLRKALQGNIIIPYAVEVQRQIIRLYDPSSHEAVESASKRSPSVVDRRWLVIRRPAVFAAGELSGGHLELSLDPVQKTYEAPIQMKANGGLLVIDDFGRQKLQASCLLSRWIVPLEQGVDTLTLHTGVRLRVPFDVIPIFVTNLPPTKLADDAFLRRIRYKVEIPNPTREEFLEILRRECQRYEVAYREDGAQHLVGRYYVEAGREMRGCQPRDIVEAIADAARYRGSPRVLSPEGVDQAAATYFV